MRMGLGLNLAQFGSSVDPSAGFALYLDFKNSLYRSGATKVSTISTVPGYTYTRSGPKQELNGTSTLVSFVANVPGIVPAIGYWSRAALTNIVLQSNAAGTTPWAGNATVTADVAVAPDGTTTMDKQVETATNAIQYNYQPVSTTASTVYTASRFYKMAERRYGRHSFVTGTSADGPYADFDLQTGTIINSGALGTGTINSASIKDVGGGVYRVTVVGTIGVTATTYMVSTIRNASTNVTTEAAQVYTGDGTSGWYSWGAQIIQGNYADGGPIIATTTATASIGADALAVGVANATYTATYTFDDLSTQVISGVVIAAGTFTLPVHPTTLTRGLVQKLVFV